MLTIRNNDDKDENFMTSKIRKLINNTRFFGNSSKYHKIFDLKRRLADYLPNYVVDVQRRCLPGERDERDASEIHYFSMKLEKFHHKIYNLFKSLLIDFAVPNLIKRC